jgi:hypothetical protein
LDIYKAVIIIGLEKPQETKFSFMIIQIAKPAQFRILVKKPGVDNDAIIYSLLDWVEVYN